MSLHYYSFMNEDSYVEQQRNHRCHGLFQHKAWVVIQRDLQMRDKKKMSCCECTKHYQPCGNIPVTVEDISQMFDITTEG